MYFENVPDVGLRSTCFFHVFGGFSRSERLCLVTVDVEEWITVGGGLLFQKRSQKIVCFGEGGVQIVLGVGKILVFRIAQDFLKMGETLLISNDFNVEIFGIILQFTDLVGSESVGRRVVERFRNEGVLGVEGEGVQFELRHCADLPFQVIHRRYRAAADVNHPTTV